MDFLINNRRIRPVALAVCASLVLGSVAVAQDTDDDGTLPAQQSSTSSSSGKSDTQAADGVMVSAPAAGLDILDPAQARLSITSEVGPTQLDTSASPSSAMFAVAGEYRYEIGPSAVTLQADGQLVLTAGFDVSFAAAPGAVARAALLVLQPAGVGLPSLLAGSAAPLFVLPIGDVTAVDLGSLQALVDHHADVLQGFAVSLVYTAVDTQGALHVAGAQMVPEGASIEIASH